MKVGTAHQSKPRGKEVLGQERTPWGGRGRRPSGGGWGGQEESLQGQERGVQEATEETGQAPLRWVAEPQGFGLEQQV